MSTLVIEVCKIDKIEPHNNADKLEFAVVKGWRTVVRKGEFKQGQKCVYFPPDAILPLSLANTPADAIPGRLGVMAYCAPIKDAAGTIVGGRVRAARLRGEQSFGVIMPLKDEEANWKVGTDVMSHFGVTKWEPPQECIDGDAAPTVAAFHIYTDIEHLANFPNVLQEGEEVVVTEKIHGRNLRSGYVLTTDDKGNPVLEFMCGSHNKQRKQYIKKYINRTRLQTIKHVAASLLSGKRPVFHTLHQSDFWEALDKNMRDMLCYIWHNVPCGEPKVSVIVFSEQFGEVQDMKYGIIGKRTHRVFDIAVNGKYMSYTAKSSICQLFQIPMVPLLYKGPYSASLVSDWTSGPTTVCDPALAGPFSGREGCVITPVIERTDEKSMRIIFKSVSADYLARKNQTDSH